MSATAETPPRATCRVLTTPRRYLVRWSTDDPALWSELLADFRATFPTHGMRTWQQEARCWSVPRRHRARLEAWLDSWFPGDALLMDEGETGADADPGHEDRRQSSTYHQPGVGELDSAYTTLHLLPSAPPALIQAAYRTLARLLHPDAGGGDEAAMVALNLAYERLQERARP
jgi:hypothetical protein